MKVPIGSGCFKHPIATLHMPVIEPWDITPQELDLTRMLKALGDPTRLRIYQFLRACCCPVAVQENGEGRTARGGLQGPTVGAVCCHLTGDEKVHPTVSFHLKELRNAGLIVMERRSRNMVCAVDERALSRISAFFDGKESPGGGDCPIQPASSDS